MRLAWPRWNLFPIAAVGLAPFLWALSRATSGKQAFYLGWTFGAVFFYVLLIWLNILYVYSPLIVPALMAMALYLGLFKGLFAWIAWKAERRGTPGLFFAVAAAWVSVEYAQSLGDLGFPWGYLGHSLWRHPPLVQLAAWTGVYGLSLIFFWMNHLIADGAKYLLKESKAPSGTQLLGRLVILALLCWFMILAASNSARHRAAPDFYTTGPFTIGLVQPNIEQRMKFRSYDWDTPDKERARLQQDILSKTISLTYPLQGITPEARCDLIIWPESAITDLYFARTPAYFTLLSDLVTSHFGAPLLFGADQLRVLHDGRVLTPEEGEPPDYASNPDAYPIEVYNSAWLVEPGRGLNPRMYNKMVLVPFAEGIPYVQRIPPLVWLISKIAGMEPFKSGTDYTIYDIPSRGRDGPPLRLGLLICYESCYPHLSRGFVRHGAEMLVVITNDAWYEQTAGPAQHQIQAVFRAVETRRWVARCANTGISCFISPGGEIVAETALARDAVLKDAVRGVKELTFYARWGDLFAWLALAVTVGAFVIPLRRR